LIAGKRITNFNGSPI